jgi:hypothetical protein
LFFICSTSCSFFPPSYWPSFVLCFTWYVFMSHKFLTRTIVRCGLGSLGGGVTVDPVSLRSTVRQRLRSEVSHGCCCYFVIKLESDCRRPLCGSWESTGCLSFVLCFLKPVSTQFIHRYLLDSQVACLTFHCPLCISTTQLGRLEWR